MTLLQAVVIAVIQGVSELFPISSLGHAVLVPALVGWVIDQRSPQFLPFLVVLHLGTAAALFLYFWRDWLVFARAMLGRGADGAAGRRVFLLVCVATLPAVVIGFGLRHALEGLFGLPIVAAAFLIVNGLILFAADHLRHAGERGLDELGWGAALLIGAAQALALIPGISRSGSTMVGGVLAGLHHDAAARFSFLLATPIILGAGVVEVPKLLHAGGLGAVSVVAGLVAGVVSYASIALLMRYFRRHEVDAFAPFGWYCIGAGVFALLMLVL